MRVTVSSKEVVHLISELLTGLPVNCPISTSLYNRAYYSAIGYLKEPITV